MAEGDRFERAFGAGWRSAYRRAREGVAPPAEVADKLVTALAKTLREMSGVPGLREMEEVVGNAARRLTLRSSGVEEEAAILIECFNALDRVVRDLDGHRNSKVAAEVAKSLLVQQGADANGHGMSPMTSHFAETACIALVEHHFSQLPDRIWWPRASSETTSRRSSGSTAWKKLCGLPYGSWPSGLRRIPMPNPYGHQTVPSSRNPPVIS
jgi:hypothetical protein